MNIPTNKRTSTLASLFLPGLLLMIFGTSTLVAQTVPDPKPSEDIKVQFDEKDPTVMYVESNGERVRVNTVTKQIERLAPLTSTAVASTQPVADKTSTQQDEPKEDYYTFESGDEPFDYKLVNVPTPKKVPRGTWNLNFSHRFSQPIHPLSESGRALFGLDSFSTSSFNIIYGITNKLYFSAGRSPLCQRGMCRVIELGLGYHLTDQTKKSPVAVSAYASIEGNGNFTEEYTYNFQAMVSRNIGNRVFLFFSPAFHVNSNGQHRFNPRPEDYYPEATAANTFKLPANTVSYGMGVQVRITPSVSGIFEYTPRTGFKLGRVDPIFDADYNVVGFQSFSKPEMGIGLQYTIGKHSFTLTFSNTQTTTTSRYNSSNLVVGPKGLVIGFNIFRRW